MDFQEFRKQLHGLIDTVQRYPVEACSQGELLAVLDDLERGGTLDKVYLVDNRAVLVPVPVYEAYQAMQVLLDTLSEARPDKTLDFHLTNEEFDLVQGLLESWLCQQQPDGSYLSHTQKSLLYSVLSKFEATRIIDQET